MNKVLKYVLVIMILVFGLFTLTGCGKNTENNELGNEQTDNKKEIEIVLSSDTTKWPNGIYDAYGIPEYKAGTFEFAFPNNENGEVYISTTFSEFKAYMNELMDKGFRIEDYDLEQLNDYDPNDKYDVDGGLYLRVLAPKQGEGYSITIVFSEAKNSRLLRAYEFEGIEEDITINYNMTMYIEKRDYPAESKDTDLLTEIGLSDEAVIPEFKLYTIEKDKDERGHYNINFDAGYDFELTKEQSNKYKMKMVNEILKVSDDGKIYDVRGNEELVTDDDKLVGAYVYKYQGTRYRIYCELSPGVNGGRMAVGVETLEN